MTTHDIRKALELLIEYDYVDLTQHVNDYSISYSQLTGSFRVENTSNGHDETYKDIESCLSALSKILL